MTALRPFETGVLCGPRDEIAAARSFPTWLADDSCSDFLQAIEKGQHVPALLDHLGACQAALPGLHCDILGLPEGATYADAVRALEAA